MAEYNIVPGGNGKTVERYGRYWDPTIKNQTLGSDPNTEARLGPVEVKPNSKKSSEKLDIGTYEQGTCGR